MKMNNITLTNWFRATVQLRVILLVIALLGKVMLYIFKPPYFLSKQPLIIPFSLLVTLDVAWVIFTSIIIVECVRVITFAGTSSWTPKKHFAVMGALIALLVFYKVVIVAPKTSVHYYKYGWSLAEKKEYQQAIRSLDISIHYNHRSITAYLERAYVYRQLGNFRLALAECNKAIDIASNNARAYASRGQTYYHLGEYPRALSDFEKAISLDYRQSETLGKWIEGAKRNL
jgi:hypothetical protein